MPVMNGFDIFRVLFLADTHIGLDFPLKPRVERRRRGLDFLANFRLALQPALRGEADAVIHGGDLFDRSRVPDALVQIALEPLLVVAQTGAPVFLVPGNHERGRIPLQVWRSHANLHVFDQPGCVTLDLRGQRVCIGGFPFARKIRTQFAGMVRNSGLLDTPAGIRLLCMHQAVEGAQVGPADFTFRRGPDVIRGADLPHGAAAFLSGHIHRAQVLRKDLLGSPLPAPVIYPGSVERTAFAEKDERKGYWLLEFIPDTPGGRLLKARFTPLPARPMAALDIPADIPAHTLYAYLRAQLGRLDPEAVVQLRPQGELCAQAWQVLGAASLRSLAPPAMNIEVSYRKPHPPSLRDAPLP
jgi:DNA repair exonuclease SbcCD nuclease subunit